MNWIVMIIVGIFLTGLVLFTIIRNQKDKKEFGKKLNNSYPKKKDDEGDIEIEY